MTIERTLITDPWDASSGSDEFYLRLHTDLTFTERSISLSEFLRSSENPHGSLSDLG